MDYKIILGDCELKLKELDDDSIDLTWTSPPYYNAKSYSEWSTYDDYLDFLKNVFTEVYRLTKDGRMCVVNLSPVIVPRESRNSESKRLPIPFHFFSIMEKIGWKYLDDITWVKPEGSAINRNGGFFQHRKPVAYKPNLVSETIFVFQKPANFLIDKIVRSYTGDTLDRSLVKGEYERSNVWYINPETHSKHLAPYPEELSDNIIKYYSFVGDTVLDPFLGSGTTLISTKKHDRKCIGIEIHQEYIDLIEKRIKDFDKKNSQTKLL
jgi:DNA modification methylase